MIKKEQYEKLQGFKEYLIQAKSNFCRISNSNLRAVSEIYFDITGKRMSAQQLNCTSCVLKMLKGLAKEAETYESVVNGVKAAAEARRKAKENGSVENSNEPEQNSVEEGFQE